jgi:hypothetical protein
VSLSTHVHLPRIHQPEAATVSGSSLSLGLLDKQTASGTWKSSDDLAFSFQFHQDGSPSFLEDLKKALSRSEFQFVETCLTADRACLGIL